MTVARVRNLQRRARRFIRSRGRQHLLSWRIARKRQDPLRQRTRSGLGYLRLGRHRYGAPAPATTVTNAVRQGINGCLIARESLGNRLEGGPHTLPFDGMASNTVIRFRQARTQCPRPNQRFFRRPCGLGRCRCLCWRLGQYPRPRCHPRQSRRLRQRRGRGPRLRSGRRRYPGQRRQQREYEYGLQCVPANTMPRGEEYG